MAKDTPIQWCDSAVNPVMGCDGCPLWSPAKGVADCYAGVLHRRHGGKNKGYAPSFEQVTLFPGRTAEAAGWADLAGVARPCKPWLEGRPRLIFVSDMGDALSRAVDFAYLEAEIVAAAASPGGARHRWLWLSKRPARMAEFSAHLEGKGVAWPQNLWAGTSILAQSSSPQVDALLRVGIPSTVRFLSVEPLHERVDLSPWLPRIDWVICGGSSSRTSDRPFDLSWARDLRDQCRAAGVPFFLKQLGVLPIDGGERVKTRHAHGGDWSEWPADLRVREMPLRGADPLPLLKPPFAGKPKIGRIPLGVAG